MSEVSIIVPAYNEGDNIEKLLYEIEAVANSTIDDITVIIVDDASTDDSIGRIKDKSFSKIKIRIINLMYNMGHQAAIGQGLLFAHSLKPDFAIVMDGDGEDDPDAIKELLNHKDHDVINVVRGRRRESGAFRVSYFIYRILFKMITKKKMNYGNFCMISNRVIEIFSVRTFIHFAAFVSKLGFSTVSVNSDRRPRLGGKAKMSAGKLVRHAFNSFAEYGEATLMVFLRLFIILFIFFIITIAYIIYLKTFTKYAILGWSSTFGIGLLTSALICMGFFVIGILQLNIAQRSNVPPAVFYKVIR